MLASDFLFEEQVSLIALYDDDELNDETEAMYNYIDEDDYYRLFNVKTMSPEQAMEYKTPRDDITVFDSYNDYADEEQEELVNYKIKHWDANRIILTINDTVLDGNHHLVAGILSHRNIKYIDLADYEVN